MQARDTFHREGETANGTCIDIIAGVAGEVVLRRGFRPVAHIEPEVALANALGIGILGNLVVAQGEVFEFHHRETNGNLEFIEIDVDDKKNKYLVIHSGSRNLGVQVCKYWQEVGVKKLNKKDNSEIIARLKAEGRQKEIQSVLQEIKQNTNVIPKDLAYIEGTDLDLYLQDMQECQNYAHVNRIQIAKIILEKAELDIIDYFQTIHNYIDIPNKIIRKGAITADKGEKVIIPMNMRDGSLICIGKGNEDWLCSAPHGAGRIMSRNQASEQITMEDFKNSMDGIYTTSVNENTIDEAPMAYKSAEVIQEDIKDTVEIVKVIKPIYNFKAN